MCTIIQTTCLAWVFWLWAPTVKTLGFVLLSTILLKVISTEHTIVTAGVFDHNTNCPTATSQNESFSWMFHLKHARLISTLLAPMVVLLKIVPQWNWYYFLFITCYQMTKSTEAKIPSSSLISCCTNWGLCFFTWASSHTVLFKHDVS